MLNVLVVVGRLTKDPTIQKFEKSVITKFDIAVNNAKKEADGTRGVTYLQVVYFSNVDSKVSEFLKKGMQVGIKGAIQQRDFQRKDGTKGTAYEVLADSIEFLEPSVDKSEMGKENAEESELPSDEEVKPEQEAKFDPYTGKPLNPKKK